MDIAPSHQEWLEIWSCFPSVDTGERWFVDHCTRNSKATVADCASASEADDAAAQWGLPMVYIQA